MNAYQAGQVALCGDYFQYTPTGASQFQKAGRWTLTPSIGYVPFFYNASLKRIAHVAAAVVSAATQNPDGTWNITTIEGNTSAVQQDRNGGEVREKTYKNQTIGGKNWFSGFGVPIYGKETCSVEDVLDVARSQIGYEEKASAKDLDDPHANRGSGNYTKYGKWYGYNPAQWCGQFCSWVFYQACLRHRNTGWIQQDDGSWVFRKADGTLARDEWLFIDGRWYVFLHNGVMVTGWFKSLNLWYYMAGDGAMCASQWVQTDGRNYYLTSSGAMATEAYVRSDMPFSDNRYVFYWVNKMGQWEPSMDTTDPDLKKYELVK